MKNIIALISIFLLFGSFSLYSQKHTVSGTIIDKKTGETILHVNIYDNLSSAGTISNFYGFYSLTLYEGNINISFSYVGYETQTLSLYLKNDTSINISLNPNINIDEAVIKAIDRKSFVENTQMSMIDLPIKEVKQLPVILGEVDILKSIQLMPGVQSGVEGSSGVFIRGGSPDQNLILLDGVPVYNANHLFGFFSVFNADAIQNVSLIKGGFPARYGGRLSSVIDIKMKEGNKKEFKGEGSIGLISSKLTLEGPIIRDKTSFIVSGRRTYFDVFTWPYQKINSRVQKKGYSETAGYYFYDLNAKINHQFSDKSKIFLSAYFGKDKSYFKNKQDFEEDTISYFSKEDASLEWGNITTALRWNYIFSPILFGNFSASYSKYIFNVFEDRYAKQSTTNYNNIENQYFNYYSGISDYSYKMDFDLVPGINHYMRFGGSIVQHKFDPGVNVFRETSDVYNNNPGIDTTFGNTDIYAKEYTGYFEDEIKIGKRIKTNLGLHFNAYDVRNKFYNSLQPRISTRFLISQNLSLKASYVEMAQNIHLLTNSTIGLPTDLWVPATNNIKPQKSKQIAFGAAYNYKNKYEFSIEAYYKEMDRLIEYKEGASFFSVKDDWEEKVESGQGWSRGIELFVQKKTGKLAGWIGYTLSKTDRQFENISFGQKFPYKFDRRHDLSIVSTFKLNDHIDLGLSWIYASGLATTLPVEKFISPLEIFNYNKNKIYGIEKIWTNYEYYGHRNAYRMNSYHRLDLGANFHKKTKWGERTWNVGAYNVYSRMNPFLLYITNEHDEISDQSKKVIKEIGLLPIIPYVSYSFKF